MSFGQTHSKGLKSSLFKKARSPNLETLPNFVKYDIISLLPNEPSCYDEHLHEEIMSKLTSSFIYHRVEVRVEILVNIEGALAGLTKGAGEEKVKRGFFPAIGTEHTIVVIFFKLVFLPSYDVFNIKSIHEHEPSEYSNFVRATGVSNP
jgi:hypothetical protein